MSFLDPRSWTDVDAGGNPLSWGSRKNKLLYPAYEMLRLAHNERGNSIGFSPITAERSSGKIYTGNWIASFHTIMSALILNYVNHEDSGGNWNGESAIKLWTIADILTSIGDASRVPASKIFIADWSLQQYKLLNKLRWSLKSLAWTEIFQNQASTTAKSTKQGEGANWTEAIDDYNASSFGTNYYRMNLARGIVRAGAAIASVYRCKYEMLVPGNPPGVRSCMIDWYALPSNMPGTWAPQIFNASGLPINEDRLYDFHTGSGPHNAQDTVTSNYMPLPTPQNPGGSNGEGFAVFKVYTVLKWDGANGFKFKDW